MALSTAEIMEISLDLVGWDEVPADSGIHVPGEELETALVGIDLESPEIQLAHDEGYDLVLAHHPPGGDPRVNFAPVLDKQIEFMTDHGVPEERAEEAASSIISGMEHAGHSANYRHDPSIAEHLDQPYMNVHLAPDELGRRRFREVADDLDDDAGNSPDADADPGVLVVGPPAVEGPDAPTDPDNDGLYEDVNGNGRLDYEDIQTLFDNFESDSVAMNESAYDFNANGRLDFDDVVDLFDDVN